MDSVPAKPAEPHESALRLTAQGAILLVLVVFLAFIPALRAGFIWDDEALTENVWLRTPGGLRRIWIPPGASNEFEAHYWPLVYTSFWLEQKLWGLAPLGYHLTNVLLHALNAVLLWRLLERLKLPAAWLAAAVFALHPIHVESVAWVIERKDLLSALFCLTAFLAYARYESVRSRWAYAAALALFACAMLSKSVAISLPLGLGLWVWWKRGGLGARDALRLGPFLALGALIGGYDAALATLRHSSPSGLSFVERALVAGRALWFYASKLFWPANLMTIYPRWEINSHSVLAWAYPAAAAAVLALLWARRRAWGRGPLGAVLFFAVTLGPTLGFVDFGFMNHSFVADRFQYLASIGPIALFAGLAERMAGRPTDIRRFFWGAAAAALLGILGVLTWRQAAFYETSETLFRHNLERNPGSWGAHNNLGLALTNGGSFEEARRHFEAALRIKPDSAETYHNLGAILSLQSRIDEAIPFYLEALAKSPLYYRSLANLCVAYQGKGELQKAIECGQKAVGLAPYNAAVQTNLGSALCESGRIAEGIEHFRLALQIQPDYVRARKGLSRYAPAD